MHTWVLAKMDKLLHKYMLRRAQCKVHSGQNVVLIPQKYTLVPTRKGARIKNKGCGKQDRVARIQMECHSLPYLSQS